MAILDSLTNQITGKGTAQALDWRKAIIPSKFKEKPFFIEGTTTAFGRRTVVHEFPQNDIPFIEDLGEKARIHNISGYVIGPDWEKARNDLINACRSGPGKLIHPEYGEITVNCSTCTVSENKTDAGMRADFDLEFVELPTKDIIQYVDTAEQVRKQAKTSTGFLQQIFNAGYILTNLPQFCTDFVSEQLDNLTGLSLNSVAGVISAFKSLTQFTDITIPPLFSEAIVNFTSAFNLDYTDKANGTNILTPTQAMNACIDNASRTLTYPDEKTPTIKAQNQACKQMEQLFKQTSIIQASVASTYIDYKSYDDAQLVWTKIISLYDQLIRECADSGNHNGYMTLKDCKAVFIADIKARSPSLNKVIYKKIVIPTPSLVIAYDQYEDILREQEIIDRNKIIHPGFVVSNNLEMLVQ